MMRVCAAVAAGAGPLLTAVPAAAHPMPHSVVLLDVHGSSVTAELEIPAGDLTAASGVPVELPARAGELRTYLAAHIRPVSPAGRPWTVRVGDLATTAAEQTSTGPYRELTATVELTPPAGEDGRHLTVGYDVVVHQVVTHVTLVSVRRGGTTVQAGEVRIDNRTMTVPPLAVDLGAGGRDLARPAALGGALVALAVFAVAAARIRSRRRSPSGR